MDPLPRPASAPWRARLLALVDAGEVDAALQAGLMDYPASATAPEDAPLRAMQARLHTAWDARARHRARAARLARIAGEREARRHASGVATTPAPATAGVAAQTATAVTATAPSLPPAAAAALARARARAAGSKS